MKNTYDFDSKARTRERLRKFIMDNYRAKDLSRLKVFTLCGHQTVEFDQVWDPLGIRRENITTVERDPEAYDLIRANKLGINLPDAPTTLASFIESTGQTFDVMNLDMMGQFKRSDRDILRAISARQLLTDKSVLGTWYCGHREGGDVQDWFRHHSATYSDSKDPEMWTTNRSEMISRSVTSTLMDGNLTRAPHELLYKLGLEEEYVQTVQNMALLDPQVRPLVDVINDGGLPWEPSYGSEFIKKVIERSLESKFDGDVTIRDVLFYSATQSYLSNKQERLHYISDNGTPMFVDLNLFGRNEFEGTHTLENSPFGPQIVGGGNPVPKSKRALARLVRATNWNRGHDMVERMTFGSSSNPKFEPYQNPIVETKQEIPFGGEIIEASTFHNSVSGEFISKGDALDLLSAGYTPREIALEFNGFSKGQLAAFKAHQTMGTYSKQDLN